MKPRLRDRLRRWWQKVTCRHEYYGNAPMCFKCCQHRRVVSPTEESSK